MALGLRTDSAWAEPSLRAQGKRAGTGALIYGGEGRSSVLRPTRWARSVVLPALGVRALAGDQVWVKPKARW